MVAASNFHQYSAPEGRDATARREAFVLALGSALHRRGIPAHRQEATLSRVAGRLGLEGQFFSTPTSLSASFGPPGRQSHAFARVEPGDLHLEKLVRLDEVVDDLARGEIGVEAAREEVEAIEAAPDPYGPVATTAAFALVSASAARFFGGGWAEIGVAGAVGLEVGLLALMATRVPAVSRLFLLLASAVAAAWSVVGSWALPGLSAHVVTLSSLIVLVPGLTLTVAANELASGHLVSGTARLTGAAMVFLQIGLGVVLGTHVGAMLPAVDGGPSSPPLPEGTVWLAAVAAALCLTVLFRARWRDAPWIVASALLALTAARLGDGVLAPPAPAFVGALAVGLFGNLFARVTRRPSLVPAVPGIMLLVPGSVGYDALAAMLHDDPVRGIEIGFSALLSAVALAAGMLVAAAALPPRRDL